MKIIPGSPRESMNMDVVGVIKRHLTCKHEKYDNTHIHLNMNAHEVHVKNLSKTTKEPKLHMETRTTNY